MERDQMVAGRYRLRKLLATGSSSVLWRASDHMLGREVALKAFFPGLSAETQERIRIEARAAARLRHRHVAEVYDCGDDLRADPPVLFVVMELVDGRSLAELLAGGAVHWRTAVEIAAEAASALAAAHARGILHGDLSAESVLIAPSGVKIVDFGLAATVTPEEDVHSLGLLLYQLLTGEVPWGQETPVVLGLPPAIAELCRRCLAASAGERPSAATVAEALGAVAFPNPATGVVPPRNRHPYAAGPQRPGIRRASRRP